MARGILSFPGVVLTALFVLSLFHQTCSVKDIHLTEAGRGCSSSCGSIENISYPFRLTEDPPNCGDHRYNLSCENNIPVLYLYGGRYYVREISYSDYTIRVVDSGIQRDNFSSIPRYFLTYYNFSSGDPYSSNSRLRGPITMVFLSCEKRVNSRSYWNVSTNCFKNGVYSSNSSSSSQMHRYVAYGLTPYPKEVEVSCRIELISLISREAHRHTKNASCEEIHNELLYGFKLYWLQVYCECDYCYLDDANKIQCHLNETREGSSSGFFKRLEGVYNVASPKELILLVFYLGLYLIAKLVMGTPIVLAFLIYKWRRRHLSMYDAIEDFLQSHNNFALIRYSYPQIRKMSKNFKDKLGGGFGTVFKGTLRSGRLVAIKILTKSKANGQDFISEVATIGRIHHVNVVQLIGFCVEGSKRALVYEFMSKGSLNDHIFMSEGSILISYKKMHEIALGVARGIEYLHQGCDIRILHFDIMPHNILLDENLNPKLSYFGLEKSFPIHNSIVSMTTPTWGTSGYMAPEFFYKNIGGISYKADVYSFGMLLMEMACRRKNLNAFAEHSSQIYFPTWAYEQLHDGNDIEMEEYATKEEEGICKLMIIVALWCIQMKPSDRPSMNKVVEMLEGEVESLQLPPNPLPVCTLMHSNESSQSSSIEL